MTVIDHIAIRVPDVVAATDWYLENVGGSLTHVDEYYRRIAINNTNIALIDESRYPDNHIGILIENIEDLPEKGYRKEHRDGTIGVYVEDPYGNMVEYIWYSEEAKALVHKPHQ